MGACARSTGLLLSSVARWVFLARRGGHPALPAADAPFGTGVMEAESPESELIGTPELAVEPLGWRAHAPTRRSPRSPRRTASDAFGACVFDEPRSTPRPGCASRLPSRRPSAPSRPWREEPAVLEPAPPETALPESALPESALPDAVLPEQPHGEEPAPNEACRPRRPRLRSTSWGQTSADDRPEPPAWRPSRLRSRSRRTHESLLRQVRAEWRAQGSKPESAPTEAPDPRQPVRRPRSSRTASL